MRFRRIVVNVSADTRADVFDAAADIARWLRADLAGLFIEDESVLGIADLPFAAEVAVAGAARPLRRDDIERAFRAASAGARRRFESAAHQARIAATFARERGAVRTIVERIAGPADIVMYVEPGRAIERACAVTSGIFTAAFASRGSVLYVPEAGLAWRGGVAALVDGNAGRPVLAAAATIASASRAPLTVATRKPGSALHELVDEILRDLEGEPPQVDILEIGEGGTAAALAPDGALGDRMVVLARTSDVFASPEAVRLIAGRRRAPLLLVEPDAPDG